MGIPMHKPPRGVTREEWRALTPSQRSRLRRRLAHRCVTCNRRHERDADKCARCRDRATAQRYRLRHATKGVEMASIPSHRGKRRIGPDSQLRLARLVEMYGTGEKLRVMLASSPHTIQSATTIGVTEAVAARLETRLRELVP